MKNPKIIYHISWVFALVSLVCIGFSSWNITNQIGGQSLTGSIKADSVINSSDYIVFSENHGSAGCGMEVFYYTDTHFVQNGQKSTAGYVTAYYYLSTTKCKEYLGVSGDNAIKVDCTLTGVNTTGALGIFSSISGRTVSAIEEVGSLITPTGDTFTLGTTDQMLVSTDTACTFSFILTDMLSAPNSERNLLTVSFKFEVPMGGDFTNFYNELGTDPEFTFSTRISGVTV